MFIHIFFLSVFPVALKTNGHLPVIGPVLGAYAIFTQNDGNPSGIEREYVEMWF